MRVVVADDADRVRTALARALDLEGFQVEAVENGWAAIESVRRQTPAALILDRVMPGIDGVEVCRRLRQMGYELPILMLTVKDSVADKVEGLVAGADDYMVKPFALDELIARLQALLRRVAGPSGDLLTFADLTVDLATREGWRGERKLTLTRTEFSLLAYFMQHPRRVLARPQILEAVWGFPEDTRSNTLEVYVGYLRRKLEEGGEPRLIETIRGVGYSLRAP
jgi:two-component system response regulator MprA